MLTAPRLPWFRVTAEACRANAVISARAMMYRIRIICRGQIIGLTDPHTRDRTPRLRIFCAYLYAYLPLIFKDILQLQYGFEVNTIRTYNLLQYNLYLHMECWNMFFFFLFRSLERNATPSKETHTTRAHSTSPRRASGMPA